MSEDKSFADLKVGDEVYVHNYKGVAGTFPYYNKTRVRNVTKMFIEVAGDSWLETKFHRTTGSKAGEYGHRDPSLVIAGETDSIAEIVETNRVTDRELMIRRIQSVKLEAWDRVDDEVIQSIYWKVIKK